MYVDMLTAIINIIKEESLVLKNSNSIVHNRANSLGAALENYVQEAYAGVIGETDRDYKLKRISEVFSYIGNNTNPPDGMVRGGEAIEIKKIQNRGSELQLNSSNPKSRLYSSDTRLNKNAVNAEDWDEKDFTYIVGFMDKNTSMLKEISFIDASVYCADKEIYDRLASKIKEGISDIPDIEVAENTNELSRVNGVDPLNRTSLRVRGMWLLANPFKAFSDIYKPKQSSFNLFALISKERFEHSKYKKTIIKMAESIENLLVEDILVKDPSNPARPIECKKITFFR